MFRSGSSTTSSFLPLDGLNPARHSLLEGVHAIGAMSSANLRMLPATLLLTYASICGSRRIDACTRIAQMLTPTAARSGPPEPRMFTVRMKGTRSVVTRSFMPGRCASSPSFCRCARPLYTPSPQKSVAHASYLSRRSRNALTAMHASLFMPAW